MRLPLPLGSYRRSSPERLVNCYPEQKPADSKSPVALVRAPGITRIASLGLAGRGLALFNGYLWAIAGGRLFRINTRTGSIEDIGIINGRGLVSTAVTVDRLCIVGDRAAYLVDTSSNISQISSPDFRQPGTVRFLDNYLLFTEQDSGRFFSSNLNDPESYSALNFATAESQPDVLVGMEVDHGQIFLAGENSCELWANVGGGGFPFARVSNGTIELGCAAGRSLAKHDNSIFWLASDLTVRRLSGVTPVRVSTHGIEDAIQGYGDVSGAHAFAFTFSGHLQYALTFPYRGTWVYDITTNLWHERKSYLQPYWRVVGAVQFGPDTWVMHEDGRIGVLELNRYTEFGDTQVVSWTTQPIYNDGERFSLPEVELMVKSQ